MLLWGNGAPMLVFQDRWSCPGPRFLPPDDPRDQSGASRRALQIELVTVYPVATQYHRSNARKPLSVSEMGSHGGLLARTRIEFSSHLRCLSGQAGFDETARPGVGGPLGIGIPHRPDCRPQESSLLSIRASMMLAAIFARARACKAPRHASSGSALASRSPRQTASSRRCSHLEMPARPRSHDRITRPSSPALRRGGARLPECRGSTSCTVSRAPSCQRTRTNAP